MAKATRDAKLETRTARASLRMDHEPYWRLISEGLYLGYRKGRRGGKWLMRQYIQGKYQKRVLGLADDHRDSNGIDVLTYFEAQDKARKLADQAVKIEAGIPAGPYTVEDAINDYLAWAKMNNTGFKQAEYNAKAYILPILGKKRVDELTTREIRKWHEGIASSPPRLRSSKFGEQKFGSLPDDDLDAKRRRKATANRVLTILKAALTRAWEEEKVKNDHAWRKVKPFKNVDAAGVRYLSTTECKRLINVCEPDFRQLVQAALYTGARYGSLIKMRCHDYNGDAGSIHIKKPKSGRSFHIPLTNEGQAFFEAVTAGRPGLDVIFLKNDGSPWAQSQQHRRIREACDLAKIHPRISFHHLRHSYGSLLAMRNVSIQTIATAMGHADTRMTHRHYAHLSPGHVAKEIRKNLPSFGKARRNNVRVIR